MILYYDWPRTMPILLAIVTNGCKWLRVAASDEVDEDWPWLTLIDHEWPWSIFVNLCDSQPWFPWSISHSGVVGNQFAVTWHGESWPIVANHGQSWNFKSPAIVGPIAKMSMGIRGNAWLSSLTWHTTFQCKIQWAKYHLVMLNSYIVNR